MVHRLRTMVALDDDDVATLAALPMRLRTIAANAEITMEGETLHECCLVLEGVLCRHKFLSCGTRQILSFHMEGDLPELQGLYVPTNTHSLSSVTRARIAHIPLAALREAAHTKPRVAHALALHQVADARIFGEWIVNIGRRPGVQRVAHLLCEFYTRLNQLELAKGDLLPLPLTQTDIADATGLSNVHVNRIMQALRGEGLIRSQGRHHRILDWTGLRAAGDFNDRYLLCC